MKAKEILTLVAIVVVGSIIGNFVHDKWIAPRLA